MARKIADIEKDFQALTATDFDLWNETSNGQERLYELTDELLETSQPSLAAEIMFQFMERLDECNLGEPGPLIHALEKLSNYEDHLYVSVERKPTPLSLRMINRILNATKENNEKRVQLLLLLRESMAHALASGKTKQEAKFFLDYQTRNQ